MTSNMQLRIGASFPLGQAVFVLTVNSELVLSMPKGVRELRVHPDLKDLEIRYAPSTRNLTVASNQTVAFVLMVDTVFGDVKAMPMNSINMMAALATFDVKKFNTSIAGEAKDLDPKALLAKAMELLDREDTEIDKLLEALGEEGVLISTSAITMWFSLLMTLDWAKLSEELGVLKDYFLSSYAEAFSEQPVE